MIMIININIINKINNIIINNNIIIFIKKTII